MKSDDKILLRVATSMRLFEILEIEARPNRLTKRKNTIDNVVHGVP